MHKSVLIASAAPSASAQPDMEVKTGVEDVDQWDTYIANLVYENDKHVAVDPERIDDEGNSSREKYNDYGIKKVSSIAKTGGNRQKPMMILFRQMALIR